MSNTIFTEVLEKVRQGNATVGILGMGYVGLPLAVLFADRGVQVIGIDKSEDKISKIKRGDNYIGDIEDCVLQRVVDSGKLKATTDFEDIANCDAIIICVPTPLDRFKKPDMSYIASACESIGKYITPGTFVSLESTTYPTTTETFIKPIIENKSGLKAEEDFWLAYSPERVDPGNEMFKTENTAKVIGALSSEGMQIGKEIYGKAINSLYPVSSPKVAEMVKILENTYRLINISLVNELALLSGKMDIDIWEVIDAAKSKPFGFQAFYPGPGIGGHCINLDPFYLEHIAKQFNFDMSMIHTAGHIDTMMPHRMTIKISSALNRHKKAINGSKILFLGVAYKPDIDDERESPALKIIDEVIGKGGITSYHDPYIGYIKTPAGNKLNSRQLCAGDLNDADCVVITTNHKCFDVEFIENNANLIVDLRNAIKNKSDKVYKL